MNWSPARPDRPGGDARCRRSAPQRAARATSEQVRPACTPRPVRFERRRLRLGLLEPAREKTRTARRSRTAPVPPPTRTPRAHAGPVRLPAPPARAFSPSVRPHIGRTRRRRFGDPGVTSPVTGAHEGGSPPGPGPRESAEPRGDSRDVAPSPAEASGAATHPRDFSGASTSAPGRFPGLLAVRAGKALTALKDANALGRAALPSTR